MGLTRSKAIFTCVELGLLALIVGSVPGCAPEPPLNVVLVSLDTTRKDHLTVYGYDRPTSPALAELATGAVVFENAIAQMTITNPSHASMFTGLYPHTHLVGENTRTLPDERLTLTEILKNAGYQTGGFVSGHPLRSEITGIDQGFDVYDSDLRRRRNGRRTTDAALQWLGELGEGPFFLFLHLYDAHGPWCPSESLLEDFRSTDRGPKLDYIPTYQKVRDSDGTVLRRLNDYVDRYDALLRFQDELVAEVLAAVDLERTVFVVLADHGETLVDRATALNLNHGTSVFGEQIAIPFILHAPQLEPAHPREPVETVDLMPTLLALLGLESPDGVEVQGENLLPMLLGGAAPRRPIAFASNIARTANHADRGYRLRDGEFIDSAQTRRWKLIRYPGVEHDYLELYDLERDPRETRNVLAEQPAIRKGLESALEAWRVESEGGASAPELSPEDLRALRALGYLGG